MERRWHRPRGAWSWQSGLAAVAVVGVVGFGPALAAPAVAGAPVLALHPNHFASPGSAQATTGWTSSNWSGYAQTAQTGSSYSAITGNWNVPSVSATSGASYSAAWIGIDGFNNNSLIQTGTEQDFYSGSAHYAAWWTTSAQNFVEQPINEPVAPGDQITASIAEQVGTTTWNMTLTDTSTVHAGWSFTKTVTYTGPGASAEWIMEAPTVGGRIATLAHYSSPLTFDPGTVNGGNPKLTTKQGGELVVRVHGGSQVVSIPSSPDSDTDGFNMSYGSSASGAPSS